MCVLKYLYYSDSELFRWRNVNLKIKINTVLNQKIYNCAFRMFLQMLARFLMLPCLWEYLLGNVSVVRNSLLKLILMMPSNMYLVPLFCRLKFFYDINYLLEIFYLDTHSHAHPKQGEIVPLWRYCPRHASLGEECFHGWPHTENEDTVTLDVKSVKT